MRSSRLCMGILAHVDAGKTTLSEALLYTTGALRKLGRVDHQDAFLDNFSLERDRGITIFSKQASLSYKGLELDLLDTPGHVDFSAEMERTLQVLDYCLLVISGSDGVQGHTVTLWKLLEKNRIPTILFVNKMDQPGADKGRLLGELRAKLSGSCIPFVADFDYTQEKLNDDLAMCNERLMNEYLETGEITDEAVTEAVERRQVFPIYFGSALHLQGVEELLQGLRRFTRYKEYPDEFGARVFKISRDSNGNRLTHLKVTGGILKVKMPISNAQSAASESEIWVEKADTLRVYGGAGFRAVDSIEAGGVCAVTGLDKTFVGQGLGYEGESEQPILAPVLTYRLVLPEGADPVKVLGQMRVLEEEEPLLHVTWKESRKEIHVQVMGEIQTEILKSVILERFGLEIGFADGSIVYKETIAEPVVGIGHFEPLRHYAEVHLLLEPGEPGSGITIHSNCSEDVLDRNWQRLIMTHLEERTHPGVLTGSPITDIKVTLLAGKAHLKHTEGGDFRQATYRALRQGLMQAKSVLLEPVFSFILEIPTEQLGRAMSDIKRLFGDFDSPVTEGEMTTLTGYAPVSAFRDYQRELNSYSRGRGRLSCTLKGYEPCHNADEVIASLHYDPDGDTENPSASVFCAHGAGFLVEWRDVPAYAHIQSIGIKNNNSYETIEATATGEGYGGTGGAGYITQEEIEQIFQQTYRKKAQDYAPYRYHQKNTGGSILTGTVTDGKPVEDSDSYQLKKREPVESYFLVDGYNIIFAWDDLRQLSETNIDSARDKLMDICCDFQGYHGATLILVFDAYKVKGNPGSVQKYHNIYVVYTREAETADQYIEKTVHKIGKKHQVTVATSDALEQMIIWGAGAIRLSANGFLEEIRAVKRRASEEHSGESRLGNRITIREEIIHEKEKG